MGGVAMGGLKNLQYVKAGAFHAGIIASLLSDSYAELIRSDAKWSDEPAKFQDYDREVFTLPGTVGACLFLTLLDGRIAGFASWDPRQRPARAIVGHNCILPEFRGKGLGKLQIQEVLRRFHALGVKTACVSTCDHPFFIPAQRMYIACGFRELRRIPASQTARVGIIEYERQIA